MAAVWAVAWAGVFAMLCAVVASIRPQDVDAGEGPIVALTTGLKVGFISGALFSIILLFVERGKSLHELAFSRVAIWGLLASAMWPLLTEVDDRMIYMLSPLGAACAVGSLAIARSSDAWIRRRTTTDSISQG